MKCESCRNMEYTSHDSVVETGEEITKYACEVCGGKVELEYCRGHDLFFEITCPCCDEIKGDTDGE